MIKQIFFSENMASTLVSCRFLWILREVWNMVQIVYAIMGLVVGFIYWYVRDRKIGRVRTFLEEIIL